MEKLRGHLSAMTDKVTFKKAIGNAFKEHAFQKKGQSWYLHGPDCIVVLNLQKDEFSDLYYVNFGVWLLAFGDVQYPPENQCHIGARLEELFPNQRELIIDSCTIGPQNTELPDFIEFIHSDVVPLSQRCLTLEGLKAQVESERISHYYVVRVARPVLGLPERK